MDLVTNMFRQLHLGPKKAPTPYLSLTQPQRVVLSIPVFLLLWEGKTSNGKKVHLD